MFSHRLTWFSMPKRRRGEAQAAAASSTVGLTGGNTQHAGIVKQWKEGRLCDVEVVAGGQAFLAHRCALAACSSYFDGAFAGAGAHMTTSTADGVLCHTIDEMPAAVLEAAISFMYEGECKLASNELLVPLLASAARLQSTELFDAVAAKIGGMLTVDSCIGAWALAERYTAPALEAAAAKFCLEHFNELVANETIGALSPSSMVLLLGRDNLLADKEEDVFVGLEAWWRAQSPAPDSAVLVALAKLVRFPVMKKEFVRGRVRQSALMQPAELRDVVTDALLDDDPPRARVLPPVTGSSSRHVAGGSEPVQRRSLLANLALREKLPPQVGWPVAGTMQVTIPPGWVPGQKLRVTATVDGQQKTFELQPPAGVRPGQRLAFRVGPSGEVVDI